MVIQGSLLDVDDWTPALVSRCQTAFFCHQKEKREKVVWQRECITHTISCSVYSRAPIMGGKEAEIPVLGILLTMHLNIRGI